MYMFLKQFSSIFNKCFLVKKLQVILKFDMAHCIRANIEIYFELLNSTEHKNLEDNEELVLNCLATINNLSFYNIKNSAITQRQMPLAKCEYCPSFTCTVVRKKTTTNIRYHMNKKNC